jgi:eukaryotic-like serine/threonine-protein kinase
MQRGALRDLTVRVQRYQREALERGDFYGWTHIVTAGGFLLPLIADRPEEALELVSQAMARWPRDSFHLQHFFEMMAVVQVDLYQGGTLGLERLDALWPALKRSMLLRVPIIFASASWMLALSILAARQAAPAKYPHAIKRVRAIRVQISKVDAPHCSAWARLLDAQLAYAEGDKERARVLADEARAEIAHFGLGLLTERVQYLCGLLTPGAAGVRLREDALATLRAQGVVDPYRYVRQAVPVLEAP